MTVSGSEVVQRLDGKVGDRRDVLMGSLRMVRGLPRACSGTRGIC